MITLPEAGQFLSILQFFNLLIGLNFVIYLVIYTTVILDAWSSMFIHVTMILTLLLMKTDNVPINLISHIFSLWYLLPKEPMWQLIL